MIDLNPFSFLVEPDDDVLRALNARIASSPNDFTARLVKADRLDELARPQLAAFERASVRMAEAVAAFQANLIAAMGLPNASACYGQKEF